MAHRSEVLYVSPHADDVAFSAAGQLARDVAAGARTTVMTLFEPPEPQRRGEDDAFARAFGATLLRGEWPDAVVRRRRYRSPARLFAPLRADEAPLVEAVRVVLQARVDGGASRVVAPLGVGRPRAPPGDRRARRRRAAPPPAARPRRRAPAAPRGWPRRAAPRRRAWA